MHASVILVSTVHGKKEKIQSSLTDEEGGDKSHDAQCSQPGVLSCKLLNLDSIVKQIKKDNNGSRLKLLKGYKFKMQVSNL